VTPPGDALERPPSCPYNKQLFRGTNSVVECNLAKVEVAGSNPVSRFYFQRRRKQSNAQQRRGECGNERPTIRREVHFILLEVARAVQFGDITLGEQNCHYRRTYR
jgi:hypothetical protein